MEAAIRTIIEQFKLHAKSEGAAGTLSKEEFQNLVTAELSNYAKNMSVDQLMSELDEDNDGELTFLEFWKLIGRLAGIQEKFL